MKALQVSLRSTFVSILAAVLILWLTVVFSRTGVHIYAHEAKIIFALAYGALCAWIWRKVALPDELWSLPTVIALALIWFLLIIEGMAFGLFLKTAWFWPILIPTALSIPVFGWLLPQAEQDIEEAPPDNSADIAFSEEPFEKARWAKDTKGSRAPVEDLFEGTPLGFD